VHISAGLVVSTSKSSTQHNLFRSFALMQKNQKIKASENFAEIYADFEPTL
jgi:hypothetical protein